jgi:hypothetical protein
MDKEEEADTIEQLHSQVQKYKVEIKQLHSQLNSFIQANNFSLHPYYPHLPGNNRGFKG